MIGRLRGRRTFQRLAATGTRINRGALWCTWCSSDRSQHPSVGFVITRAYGSAVKRNRLRRQLRALIQDMDRQKMIPPVMLLLGARPAAQRLTFDQLRQLLEELVEKIQLEQLD